MSTTRNFKTDDFERMVDFIENARQAIDDERPKEAYGKVVEAVKTGMKHTADNLEKKAWLNYVLCDQSYRIGFYLYRHRLLNKDLEKELFTFELPEVAIEYARSFRQADDEIKKRIMEETLEVDSRRKGIEIFQAILAGTDPEAAKEQMREYEERTAKALGQLPQQAPSMQ